MVTNVLSWAAQLALSLERLSSGKPVTDIAAPLRGMVGEIQDIRLHPGTTDSPPVCFVVGTTRTIFLHLGVQNLNHALLTYNGWNNPSRFGDDGELVNGFAYGLFGTWFPYFTRGLNTGTRLIFAGHSLGGMVVPLLAKFLDKLGSFTVDGIATFGSPRFTTKPENYNGFGDRLCRFMDDEDLVPNLVPSFDAWPALTIAAGGVQGVQQALRFIESPGIPGTPPCFSVWPLFRHVVGGILLLGGQLYNWVVNPPRLSFGPGPITNIVGSIRACFQLPAHNIEGYAGRVFNAFPSIPLSLPAQVPVGDLEEEEPEEPEDRHPPPLREFLILEPDGGIIIPTPEVPLIVPQTDVVNVETVVTEGEATTFGVTLQGEVIARFASKGKAGRAKKKLARLVKSFNGDCTVSQSGMLAGWGGETQAVANGISVVKKPPTVEP